MPVSVHSPITLAAMNDLAALATGKLGGSWRFFAPTLFARSEKHMLWSLASHWRAEVGSFCLRTDTLVMWQCVAQPYTDLNNWAQTVIRVLPADPTPSGEGDFYFRHGSGGNSDWKIYRSGAWIEYVGWGAEFTRLRLALWNELGLLTWFGPTHGGAFRIPKTIDSDGTRYIGSRPQCFTTGKLPRAGIEDLHAWAASEFHIATNTPQQVTLRTRFDDYIYGVLVNATTVRVQIQMALSRGMDVLQITGSQSNIGISLRRISGTRTYPGVSVSGTTDIISAVYPFPGSNYTSFVLQQSARTQDIDLTFTVEEPGWEISWTENYPIGALYMQEDFTGWTETPAIHHTLATWKALPPTGTREFGPILVQGPMEYATRNFETEGIITAWRPFRAWCEIINGPTGQMSLARCPHPGQFISARVPNVAYSAVGWPRIRACRNTQAPAQLPSDSNYATGRDMVRRIYIRRLPLPGDPTRPNPCSSPLTVAVGHMRNGTFVPFKSYTLQVGEIEATEEVEWPMFDCRYLVYEASEAVCLSAHAIREESRGQFSYRTDVSNAGLSASADAFAGNYTFGPAAALYNGTEAMLNAVP